MEKAKKTLQAVFEEIMALDDAEFNRKIELHKDGAIATELLETGALECNPIESII